MRRRQRLPQHRRRILGRLLPARPPGREKRWATEIKQGGRTGICQVSRNHESKRGFDSGETTTGQIFVGQGHHYWSACEWRRLNHRAGDKGINVCFHVFNNCRSKYKRAFGDQHHTVDGSDVYHNLLSFFAYSLNDHGATIERIFID